MNRLVPLLLRAFLGLTFFLIPALIIGYHVISADSPTAGFVTGAESLAGYADGIQTFLLVVSAIVVVVCTIALGVIFRSLAWIGAVFGAALSAMLFGLLIFSLGLFEYGAEAWAAAGTGAESFEAFDAGKIMLGVAYFVASVAAPSVLVSIGGRIARKILERFRAMAAERAGQQGV